MHSIKQQIKRILGFRRGGFHSSIDLTPARVLPADKSETALSGWAFHADSPVVLQLEFDGRIVAEGVCTLPRPDVHACHPTSRFSLASGFALSFPTEDLAGLYAGRLRVLACAEGQSWEIWSWAGTDAAVPPDARPNDQRFGCPSAGWHAPGRLLKQAPKNVHLVVGSRGQLVSLEMTLKGIAPVLDRFGGWWGGLPRISVICPGAALSAVRDLVQEGPLRRKATVDLCEQESLGAWAALPRLAGEDLEAWALLYVREGVDLGCLDAGALLSSIGEVPAPLVMPAPYGETAGFPGPAGVDLATAKLSGLNGALPWMPSTHAGPVWLARGSFLGELDKAGGPLRMPPEDGRFIYYYDLARPVFAVLAGEDRPSEAERAAAAAVMRTAMPVFEDRRAWLVIGEDWRENLAQCGRQYQALCLAEALREDGCDSLFVEERSQGRQEARCRRGLAPSRKVAGGRAVAALEEMPEGAAPEWVVALSSDERGALAAAQATGAQAAALRFPGDGRGAALPLRLPCLINRELFCRRSLVRHKKSAALIFAADAKEARDLAAAATALCALKAGGREFVLSAAVFAEAAGCSADLGQAADSFIEDCGAEKLAELFCTHELVFLGAGQVIAAREAMACGAVPVICGAPIGDAMLEAGVNALAAGDALRLNALLTDWLEDKLPLAALREGALKSAADFPSSVQEDLCGVLARLALEAQAGRRTAGAAGRGLTVILRAGSRLDCALRALQSTLQDLPQAFELVVVNDGLEAGAAQRLREACEGRAGIVWLDHESPRGEIEAWRTGLASAGAQHDILLIGSQAVMGSGALAALREAAYADPNVGASVAPVLRLASGESLAAAAKRLRASGQPSRRGALAETACLYLRRWAIEECGFFDPTYQDPKYALMDLAARLALRGVEVLCAERAAVLDARPAGGEISAQTRRDRALFEGRWGYYQKWLGRRLPASPPAAAADAVCIEGPAPDYRLESDLENIEEACAKAGGGAPANALREVRAVFVLPSVVLGGGSLSVLQHANELLLRGLEVRVISLTEPKALGFPLLAPILPVSLRQFFDLDWGSQRVIATFWGTAFLVSELVRRHPALAGYYYVQGDEPEMYRLTGEEKLERLAEQSYRLGLKHVVKTRHLAEVLRQGYGVDARLVTPGVDRGVFYPGQQQLGSGRPRLAALFSARTPWRGGRELVELVYLLRRRVPELIITLFGDREGLPAELADHVELVGGLSPRGVGRLYRSADIVADLSTLHGFGRMGIEGMACGAVPVLARSGGISAYAIHAENALIVEPGDVDGAAECVARLVLNRPLRLRLREAGLRRAREFSEAAAAEDWAQVLS